MAGRFQIGAVLLYVLPALHLVFADTLDRTIPGRKLSLIEGSLGSVSSNITSRQEIECPIPGGIMCNSAYCCPPGSVCQPEKNVVSFRFFSVCHAHFAYSISVDLPCCPTADLQCNGASACCVPGISRCCTTNPLGCCPVDNTPNPPTPPKPTETRIPKDTIPLDYKDMLIPRKKTQDEATRKEAVDSLFKNMCLGMKKRGALDTQTQIFTYTRSQQSANRRAACGGVKCDAGQSCDEFPFASTSDGGVNATANCIIHLGNSIQGGFLSTLLRGKKINEGDHYELKLENVVCEELLASPKKRGVLHARQQGTSGLTTQLQKIDTYGFGPFTTTDFYNHSLYYIGELSSGQYTVNVKVNQGIVDALRIVDYQGFSYASSDNSKDFDVHDPIVPLSFSLSDDAVGVTLVLDFLIDFNISASMTTGTVSSTTPNPSQPFSSSGKNRGELEYIPVALGAIISALSLGV